MKNIGAAILLTALLVSACDDNTTAPATTTTSTSPVTETFASIVGPLGTASRTFSAAAAGTISVTLTSATPAVALNLGLGVPIPSSTLGLGCALTTVQTTMPSSTAQIEVTADAGDYCVAILDVGNAPPTGVSFSITIVRP